MGVVENLAKNPAVLIIAAVGIGLFIFKDKISDFFSTITGGAETANLLGENLLSNLQGTQDLLLGINKFFEEFEFPTFENPFKDFEFPEFDFPDVNLCTLFGIGCNGNGGDNGPDLPPDVEDTGLLTPEERAACGCGTNIIQDIQGDVSETCISPCAPEEGDDDFIGPPPPEPPAVECIEIPQLTGGTINSCTGIFTPAEIPIGPDEPITDKPFEPPVDLPEGFVGGGPSFEGGTIFETNDCFLTLNQLTIKYNISASAASNLKAISCSMQAGDEPTDFPVDFDFGTNIGEATLESEAKKAACTSCELFGLNCPICSGTI